MVWAITVLVVTIGLIAFAFYKMANMGYAVRRLKDDQVVARFGTHWEAEQWLDDHLGDEDVYYLDD